VDLTSKLHSQIQLLVHVEFGGHAHRNVELQVTDL
jgi:hypothetical protein